MSERELTPEEKEEARLLAAINKTPRGSSLSKAATRSRPTPSIIPPSTTSPARQEKFAPAPSAFVRSPSQNFGTPVPKTPTSAEPSPRGTAPAPSAFVRSPSQNFGSPSPQVTPTSSSSLPRSTSQNSVPHSYNPIQSPLMRSPSNPSPGGVVKSPSGHTFTGYLPAQMNFNSPSKAYSPRPSPGTTPTNAPYRTSASFSAPITPASSTPRSEPTTPRADQPTTPSYQNSSASASSSSSGVPASLEQSLQELEGLSAATNKNASAPVTPKASDEALAKSGQAAASELDRLISDLHKTSVSPAAAGKPTYGAQSPYAPQSSASVSSAPAQSAPVASSAPNPRAYGATFGALLEHVEKEEKKNAANGEYPTPAPSSRLSNKQASIPPRPQHEDSSESLLERALVNEPVPQSSLRENRTENEEVHPAFQSTYNSINNLLDGKEPVQEPVHEPAHASVQEPAHAHVHESAHAHTHESTHAHVHESAPAAPAITATTTVHTMTPSTQYVVSVHSPGYQEPVPGPIVSTTISSSSSSSASSTTTHPSHTSNGSASKPDPLDQVAPQLAALEERSRESVPAAPTPEVTQITDSSRTIRTALESYQAETVCAGCNQGISGKHLLALDKHWHNDHLKCTICFNAITKYAESNGQPYCGPCYTKNFLAPRCNACGDFIVNELVEAVGGQFHVSCFVCAQCKNNFADGVYVESKQQKGRVYCQSCFYKVEGKKCHVCSEPITEVQFTEILGKTLHTKCFHCYGCKKPFNSMECYPVDNDPYCLDCATAKMEQTTQQ